MSWKRILVPHDFSASANHAAALARDEAKAHGAKLLLLHVIDLPRQVDPAMMLAPEAETPINLKDYVISQAEGHLVDLSARLSKDGVSATTFIRIGHPVEEIARFVTEQQIDLIVMGTHGRTRLAQLLVGSVTERVVRSSVVPVLTVRHAE